MNNTNENGKLTISLCRWIDGLNAADVQSDLISVIQAEPDAKEIVLDAMNLEYISSAGLRVILVLCQDYEIPVSIVNVMAEIYKIFQKTGFTRFIRIEPRGEIE